MGLLDLGQALAQFDALKRRVGLLASNPSEFAEGSSGPELGNAGPYPGGLLSVMPQVREHAINEALKLTPGLLGATVYHGSPYQFEKFDASKIGTGEGAQAYGYGHYLADNPKVAQQYARDLAQVNIGGKSVPGATVSQSGWIKDTPEFAAALEIQNKGYAKALAEAEAAFKSDPGNPWLFEHLDLVRGMKDAQIEVKSNLYRVDLPDEAIAKMLDWDKPLSDQPEVMKRLVPAFRQRGIPMGIGEAPGPGEGYTGSELYRELQRDLLRGGWEIPSSQAPQNASGVLGNLGIPGIKYLDQGSRAAGKGTMNYVIFPGNEGLLKILGRE